jgi:CRP/FNR family transcriptional regulator, nitrogen oxide reductase regulator
MCSVDVRLKILGKVPFFQDLSAAELKEVNLLFREVGFLANETVYFAGDPAERLFVVADGRVKLMRDTAVGKSVLFDLLTPGEFFGSLSGMGDDVYSDTAQALTPACILTIGSDAFQKILKRFPAVSLKIIGIMALRLRAAQERIQRLSVSTVEERIAHVLLVLSQKFGQAGKDGMLIQVPLSREDLAAMVGATTESASRVMSQFQRDGLIEAGRQWVAIIAPDGLKALAGSELE